MNPNGSVQFLNALAAKWWPWTVASTWQGLLVLLIVVAVLPLWRRATPGWRYGLLLVALAKFALPPVGSQAYGLFAWVGGPPQALAVQSAEPSAPQWLGEGVQAVQTRLIRAGNREVGAGTLEGGDHAMGTEAAKIGATPPSHSSSEPGEVAPRSRLTLAGWMLLADGAAVFLMVGLILSQALKLRSRLRCGRRLDAGPLLDMARSLAGQMRLRRHPVLRLCPGISSPYAGGVFRQFVMLPEWAEDAPEEDQSVLLAHELAHLRRRDPLVNWLQILALVYLPWNPLVWWINRRIRAERELCCDDLVLALGLTGGEKYSRVLVAVAERMNHRDALLQAVGMADSFRPLKRRIQRALDAGLRRPARLSLASLALLAVFAAFVLPGAPRAQGPQTGTPTVGLADAVGITDGVGITKPAVVGESLLSGRVTDGAGQPVAGVQIGLQPDAENVRSPRSVKTDERGIYAFDAGAVQAGKYRVAVEGKGFVPIRGYREMAIVDLQPDSKMVKDFTLKAACRLDVLVTDEAGQPIKEVTLPIVAKSADRFDQSDRIREPRTDADGKARSEEIPALSEEYQIAAMHSGYAPTRLMLKMDDPKTTYAATIRMSKGVEVKGRAICSDGLPAAGWRVSVQPDWWNSHIGSKGTNIAENGDFTLAHIAPGTYSISIDVPKGEMTTSYRILTTQLPPESGSLELKVPQPSAKSDIAISGTISIPGHEKESTGVEVDVRDGDRWVDSEHVMRGESKFTVSKLAAGTYDVVFRSPETQEKTIKGVQAPSSGLTVELEWAGRPKMQGAVVNAATSAPVPRFQVRLRKVRALRNSYYSPDTSWHDFSQPEGRFEMELVGPGVYQVQVAAEGLASLWSAEYNTDLDSTKTLAVALTPGATLGGRVVDEEGRPVVGAKAIPLSKAGGGMSSRTENKFVTENGAVPTAADGAFAIAHLAPGAETVKVVHPDYCFAVVPGIELKEGEASPEAKIVLTRGGTVQGRVYDATGKPQAGVTLTFQDDTSSSFENEGAGRLAVATSGADGSYRAEHLPEQTCYVHRGEDRAGTPSGVARQAILPANGKTLTLDFGGTYKVSGRLLANGKPEAGRNLCLSSEETTPYFGMVTAYTTTDAKGVFSFFGAPFGRFTLFAERSDERGKWIPLQALDVPSSLVAQGKPLDVGDVTLPVGRAVVRAGGAVAQFGPDGVSEVFVRKPHGEFPMHSVAGHVERGHEKDVPLVVTDLCPGRQSAGVTLKAGTTFYQPFDLKEGQSEVQVTVDLPTATSTLQGKYSLPQGRGVVLLRADDRVVVYVRPTGDRYSLANLPAGEYLLCDNSLGTGGKSSEIQRVKIGEGETATLDIGGPEWNKPDFGRVFVSVFSSAGLPLTGATAWLESGGATIHPTMAHDQGQGFTVKPGDYVLHAACAGFKEAQEKVTVSPAEPGAPPEKRTRLVRIRLEAE